MRQKNYFKNIALKKKMEWDVFFIYIFRQFLDYIIYIITLI